MNRLKKVVVLLIRKIAHFLNATRLYYWAEKRAFALRAVKVMPDAFYCVLYRICMWLVKEKRFLGVADWAIHRIPYDVRCNLA